MGLDMGITKKTYVKNWKHQDKEDHTQVTVRGKRVEGIKPERITYIEEEMGTWRKANAIHAWMVKHVQNGEDDCGTHYITQENMKELLGICKDIKKNCKLVKGKVKNGQRMTKDGWEDIIEDGKVMTNAEYAHNLLPTQSGFFFGGTDYDEWYMHDIDLTIKILEACIAEEGDYYYWSSW